jgi:REP element-mobilizing transposase RayT
MAHTFSNLLVHVIFSTKDRRPHLDAELKPQLFAYMGGIIRELDSKLFIINGPADHVHLLISLSAKWSVADAMRVLKTNSSRWVHEQWPQRADFAWQTGYGAFSVSHSQRSKVWKYIEGQEEHHRTVTFQEEFVKFLKAHGIEYDERYIWE